MLNQYLFPDITSTLCVTKAKKKGKLKMVYFTSPHQTKPCHNSLCCHHTTSPHHTSLHQTKPCHNSLCCHHTTLPHFNTLHYFTPHQYTTQHTLYYAHDHTTPHILNHYNKSVISLCTFYTFLPDFTWECIVYGEH